MTHSIKTGILSFGMSGKLFHAPFLNEHDGFLLNAVVERVNKQAHLIYPNIQSYHSVDKLLADADIELVVVNTPNATHFEFALKTLQAGKHALVEKPFSINSAQAKQLFQEAKKQERCIMVYQNRRYDSDLLSVKQVIDSGKLGQLVEVHLRFDRYRYEIGSKPAKETAVAGSGLLYDLGPHLLDAVIYLFGMPLKWTKNLRHFRPNTQVDDYANIHLLYPNGLQVFITVSLLVADVQPAFVVHGTKGTYIKPRADVQEKQLLEGMSPSNPLYGIEEENKQGVLTIITNDGKKIQEQITSVKSSYLQVFDDVYATIKSGKTYPVAEEQIIKQLEILES